MSKMTIKNHTTESVQPTRKFGKKSEAEGLDSLVGMKNVKEIEKKIDSLGLTFVESGDYAGHTWGYAVYKSPKGEYLQYDYNGTNDVCRSVKVYKSKQDFIDAEGYDPEKSESKKSEGISDMIDAKIDYNMFMRMCKTAAYLEEDEDYWDALWEYFSEVGSIGDACEFFDNLFQYTSWKTAKELWSDFFDILGDKPEGKDYEEALDAYLDENDNEVGNAAAFKYGDHYLMIY